METAAIHLCYCPLSFSYGSKGSQRKPNNLRFNHATPLSLPHFSTTRCPSSFGHATSCMFETSSVPPKNDASGNKILRGVSGVSVVLACVLGMFNLSGNMNPKFSSCAYAARSKFDASQNLDLPRLAKLEGKGNDAMESLLKTMNNAKCEVDNVNEAKPWEANKLKLCALSKDEKKNESALGRLRKLYGEEKTKRKAMNLQVGQEEMDLGMALVEYYMFQGEYKNCLILLDEQIDGCLKSLEPQSKSWSRKSKSEILSDNHKSAEGWKVQIAKFLLYKAIVHAMLEDKKEAVEWWKAFIKI